MSLRIRLQKPGKTIKHRRHFKIVVIEKKKARDGKSVDQIGFYNPAVNPNLVKVDLEKYEEWIKKGAEPTATVSSLVKKYKKTIK